MRKLLVSLFIALCVAIGAVSPMEVLASGAWS